MVSKLKITINIVIIPTTKVIVLVKQILNVIKKSLA